MGKREEKKKDCISEDIYRLDNQEEIIIAVGTPITECPPHRSVREELPHTAPTLG